MSENLKQLHNFNQQMKTIGQTLDGFNQQMKTIGQTLDDQDNKSLRARKKILNDLNDFKDEFSKLKGKVTSLNNDINSLEGDIKAINKKVDNIMKMSIEELYALAQEDNGTTIPPEKSKKAQFIPYILGSLY